MADFDRDPEISVRVSGHAAARFVERWPELAARHSDPKRGIYHMVLEAIRAGRVAHRKPNWCVFLERNRQDGQRYAWTEDQRITFTIRALRADQYEDVEAAHRYKQRWIVVTLLPRQDDAEGDLEARALASANRDDGMRRMKSGAWEVPSKQRRRRRESRRRHPAKKPPRTQEPRPRFDADHGLDNDDDLC